MQELLSGIVGLGIYFIICATGAILLRLTKKVPDEVFRKLLHFILLGSLSVWVWKFGTWWIAALTAVLFAVVVYPILCLAERIKGYSKFITERKSGELKASLLVVFLMFAIVVAICWGYFGDRLLALASIYAWGFGDAMAALMGKRFGKHKIKTKHTDGQKSLEGTFAMFLTSFISVMIVLILRGGFDWYGYIFTAFITAVVSAAVELYTRDGMDTITCPLAAMVVLIPLVNIFGDKM